MFADVEKKLKELLSQRILVMDGAMGTVIQKYRFGEADYRGLNLLQIII